MSENLIYFFAGLITGLIVATVIFLIRLSRLKQTAADLEEELRTHSFELQITLDELAEKNKQLQLQAEKDSLSGAYNRAYFDKQMQAELRRGRREQKPLAIVLFDIDYFKRVNDTHGHIAGDRIIKKVTKMMQLQIKRPADKLCRYGGEEFALILPGTTLSGANALAEEIRQQFNDNDLEFSITISAGCYSAVPNADSDADEYINFADKALYAAKAAGRNQVQNYRQEQGNFAANILE